jgi:tetratricopeptide (TPR) repeat protein
MLWNQKIDPTKDQSPQPFALWRPFIAAWEWLVPPTVAHRDRQSPLARYVAAGAVISLCGGLLALGVMFARPLKQRYKNMRAESMVKEARQMAENGQVVNAVMKAQEAYTNAPESEDAIRLNFEYFTMMKRDTALYFYDKLKNSSSLTPEDEQTHVRCLLNLGKPKEAAKALEMLMRTEQPSERLMQLAEEVWGHREQNKPMLSALRIYTESHPEDKESLLRLAKVQLASGNQTEAGQGMETLWKLADQNDALGLQCLEFINSLPTLPPADTQRLIERLKSHPRADDRHYVTALKREVQLEPRRKREIVMSATERYKTKKRDQLLPFIRWLVEEGEFRQVLTVLPEDDAKTHQGLLENYLNALTMLRRFTDLERLVNDPKVTDVLDPATMAMYRAHLAFILNKPTEELRSKLIAAKDAAQFNGRYRALLQIANYGEQRGHFDIAEDAYRLAIKSARRASAPPVIEREAYAGLIKASQANRDTDTLLQACREAVARWPDDTSFSEKHLYVTLLAGRDIELALRNAGSLLKIQPNDSLRKLTMALARWRLRDKQQAVQNLQYIDLNPLTEGQRAVFAAIANSNGFHDEALGVIKAINPRATMLPEEQRCYESVVSATAQN